MERVLTCNMQASCSASFKGCTIRRNLRAPVSVSPLSSGSSIVTADVSGPKASWKKAPLFISHLRAPMLMTEETTEILLVEDSPDDAAFFQHAFKQAGLSAGLHIVADGAEALEFVAGTGRYAGRKACRPRVFVLD